MVHKVKIRSQSDRQCPVCESWQTEVFCETIQTPMRPALFWLERDDALSVPKGDIKLAFCSQCGHVFNMAYNPDLVKYNQWYENSLHYSSRFQGYSRSVADRLMESYDLNRKEIVEIGFGSDSLLEMLCDLGNNRGIGFDPGYIDDPSIPTPRQRVTFLQSVASDQYARYQADLICCRQVLEQIYKPRDFVNMLRRAIGDKRGTVGFFEVSNVTALFHSKSIWNIRYQQYSYFSRQSLAYLFENSGFDILDQREELEARMVTIDIRPSIETIVEIRLPDPGQLGELKNEVETFNQACNEGIAFWQDKLNTLKSTGKKIILWGAGETEVNFLNTFNTGYEILHVVDNDWRKRGMYTAGSGHRIVTPSALHNIRPDVVIILNPQLESEIRQQMAAMDLSPEYLVA